MNEHIEGYRDVLNTPLSPHTLLRLLADPTRLRCVALLCTNGLHLDKLVRVLDMSEPAMLRHLASLRLVGVLQCLQLGHTAHYQLHPRLPAWARELIYGIVSSLMELTPFKDDRSALTQPHHALMRHNGEPGHGRENTTLDVPLALYDQAS